MTALMQLAPEGPTPGEAPNGVQPEARLRPLGADERLQADASPASTRRR